jgi:glycosyltransferase involved in cell wall biosynthesis
MATRTFDLSRRWVAAGHPTTVFVSDFNHYTFQYMHAMPWYRLWQEEDIDGVRMVWIKTTPYRLNDFRRAINMASFAVLALCAGVVRRPRPDVVIGVSVHPLAALSGWILAVVRRSRFFFEETDLWPQTLIDLGLLRADSLIARGLRSLEAFLYRRAERIVMLWRDTAPYVESLGGSAAKIVWVPHGVELSRYEALVPYEGAPGRPFRVMYLGGFVMSMSLDTILEAASILRKRGREDIHFLLVGSGTDRDAVIRKARDSGLSNVEFPNPVPKAEIASVMSSADAFIYGIRDLPLYRYGMSLNKLMDYLAGARPIIYSGNSSYNPVEIARAGYTVPPEDAPAVADAVERLVALSPEDRIAMGCRGHDYLLENHDIEALAARLLDKIVLA